MSSRPIAFAVLAAGCMTAAAGGAYVAMRHNAAPPAAQSVLENGGPAVATDAVPVATDGAARPAQSFEALAPVTEAPIAEARPAPVQRRRQTSRAASVARTPAASVAAEPAPTAAPESLTESVPLPPVAAEPAPQTARFEEIIVPSETVIGVQVETAVTSERARVEDRVEGHVTRDVAVGGRIAIPAGTKVLGSVTLVERGGKFKERARIAVRFHTAQLPDGTRVALQTTAIMREGDSPSRETAAKVGGSAVGGAILGAILGGPKGAVIGGTAGAAGGTAVVAAGDRNAATLPAGTTVSVRLMADTAVTVER